MNNPEDRPMFVFTPPHLLEVKTPKRREAPCFTPGDEIRRHFRQLAEHVETLAGLVLVDHPEAPAGLQALNDLQRMDAEEARYRSEAPASFTESAPRANWDRVRPTTTTPFALILMDYADNLRVDATTFLEAAMATSGATELQTQGGDEGATWRVYDRLGELFRHVNAVASDVGTLLDLAREWQVQDEAVLDWIKITRNFLHAENWRVKSLMSQVRGRLIG